LTGGHQESESVYATFGKTSDFKVCSPSDIFTYDDESPWSVNDAALAVSAKVAQVIDWPTYMHKGACGFAFADGHSEVHKWKSNLFALNADASTKPVASGGTQYTDWYWLAWHASRNSLTGQIP
jgi:prepilin-type processing-associated H-X9-DG protein